MALLTGRRRLCRLHRWAVCGAWQLLAAAAGHLTVTVGQYTTTEAANEPREAGLRQQLKKPAAQANRHFPLSCCRSGSDQQL